LVSLMQGTTTISVETKRLDANNQHAVDSAELIVSEEFSYTNIHPDVWRKLGLFNETLRPYAERLYFLDEDPAEVESASFSGVFTETYGVTAQQVSDLTNASAVNFNSKSSYSGSNWASAKPSISISLGSLASLGGALLPLEFTYNLSWSELGEIMGREVTRVDNPTELFGSIKLVFENAAGKTAPLVDGDGEFGIAVSQAISNKALVLTNGNNGLTLTLKALLGDVKVAADEKPQMIDGRLVVADGIADGTAAGSLWLLNRTGGGGGGSESDSGGGGCNAGAGIAVFALLLWSLRSFRRNIK
jgi:hypothetical protein